jgi:hypothetical protein
VAIKKGRSRTSPGAIVRFVAGEARAELLKLAWSGIRGWRPDNVANLLAARRAVEAGAAPQDLALAMSAAAYEAVFSLLFVLDEGGDPNGEPGPPAWAVVDPQSRSPLDGLHEGVLSADPTGQEGRDLFK